MHAGLLLRSGDDTLDELLRTLFLVVVDVRLGYGIAAPETIASLAKLRVSFNVNRLSQAAGLAALGVVWCLGANLLGVAMVACVSVLAAAGGILFALDSNSISPSSFTSEKSRGR